MGFRGEYMKTKQDVEDFIGVVARSKWPLKQRVRAIQRKVMDSSIPSAAHNVLVAEFKKLLKEEKTAKA